MRERSVVGFTPSRAAAPRGPWMTPPVRRIVEAMVKAVQVPRVPLALAKKALVPKQGIRQKYLDALEKLVNEALFGRPDTYPTPENREDFSL